MYCYRCDIFDVIDMTMRCCFFKGVMLSFLDSCNETWFWEWENCTGEGQVKNGDQNLWFALGLEWTHNYDSWEFVYKKVGHNLRIMHLANYETHVESLWEIKYLIRICIVSVYTQECFDKLCYIVKIQHIVTICFLIDAKIE